MSNFEFKGKTQKGLGDIPSTNESKDAFRTREDKADNNNGFFNNSENTVGYNDLGLGFFVSDDTGSKYMEEFKKAAAEKLTTEVDKKGVKFTNTLYSFDNTDPEFSKLSYSVVVLVTESSNTDKVYFNTMLLEATGDRPVKLSTIAESLQQVNGQPFYIFVASDAFNKNLMEIVVEVISENTGIDESKILSSSGLVIPYDIDATEVAPKALINAFNANIGKITMETGVVPPISLQRLTADRSFALKLDISSISGNSKNLIGRPIRLDFETELRRVSANANTMQRMLNSDANTMKLSTVGGYLDTVITEEQPQYLGAKTIKKAKPVIVLTEHVGIKPTIETVILNIINSQVFSNPDQLGNILLNSRNELGALNYIINLEEGKNGGERLKFKSGKFTQEQVMEALGKMFSLAPAVFLEVEAYGVSFDMQSPFAALGKPTTRSKADAFIRKICGNIVGSQIDSPVTVTDTIDIPLGQWTDNTGTVRDIREVDLAFVVEHSKDPILIQKWMMTYVPKSVSGIDPFTTRIEVINALLPDAVLTGKASRVLLNPTFVNELASKAISAGYNPKTDVNSAMKFVKTNDLQAVSSMYANAGISSVNFGTSGGFGGSKVFSPETSIFDRF